jgi:WD40 repeat protein
MAITLTLASFLLGCSRMKPDWGNEGLKPIQLGPGGTVFRLAFSPDGKYLAASTRVTGKGVIVWDVGSQKEVLTRQTPSDAIAFTRDGRTMALGAPVALWVTATWKEKSLPAVGVKDAYALAFHPTKDLLIVAGRNQAAVLLLWDLKTGKERYRKQPHKFGVSAFALSPDGSTLVTGEDTGRIWEVASGKELWSFTAHLSKEGVNHVSCAVFLPGDTFATGGNDGLVRLWDLKTKKEKAVFSGDFYRPETLTVSADGKYLVVGGFKANDLTGLVELWEISSNKRLAKLNLPTAVLSVALSPDGKWLATATGNGAKKDGPNPQGALLLWKMADVLRQQHK